MTPLTLTRQMISETPRVLVIRLAGTLDTDNGRFVDDYVKEALASEQPCHILLDLSGLPYVPSVLLSSLLFWRDQMKKRGGTLVLFAVQPFVADLLRTVGFHRLFTLKADQETALAAVPAN